MTTTDSKNSVDQHMLDLRKRLIAAKLANEREKLLQRPQSEENNDELENQARLQQAMLRRQELLDRIRKEQMMNDEARRARTSSARKRYYTPSPLPVPPSRRSLPPNFHSFNYQEQQQPQMSKHVIEHHVVPSSPRQQQYNLPPVENPHQPAAIYQPPPQRPIVLAPPPPPMIMAQPPQPAIIAAPQQPHIIAHNPQPQITYLGNPPAEKRDKMFSREDFMDMMLMQNAQMHHMVMQQLMAGTLKQSTGSNLPSLPVLNESQLVAVQQKSRQGTAVHHHHYTAPAPAPEPVVNTYTTMPAYELRGGTMPMRDYYPQYEYVYADDYPRSRYYYDRDRRTSRGTPRDRDRRSR